MKGIRSKQFLLVILDKSFATQGNSANGLTTGTKVKIREWCYNIAMVDGY